MIIYRAIFYRKKRKKRSGSSSSSDDSSDDERTPHKNAKTDSPVAVGSSKDNHKHAAAVLSAAGNLKQIDARFTELNKTLKKSLQKVKTVCFFRF